MAGIDFPASPLAGQQFTYNGVVWTWDGVKWTAAGNTLAIADAPADGQIYGRQAVSGVMSWQITSGSGGGLADSAHDGTFYGRKNGAWVNPSHSDITDWSAFVPQASTASPQMNGTAAPGSTGFWADGGHIHPTDISRAPLASPAFTGAPIAPLPTPPTNNTSQLATCAWVNTAISTAVGGSGVTSWNTRTGAVTLTNGDVLAVLPAATALPLMNGVANVGGISAGWATGNHVHPVDTSRYAANNPAGYQTLTDVSNTLTSYALLASPVFSGVPAAPNPSFGTSNTQIATTFYVATNFAPLVSPTFTGTPNAPTVTPSSDATTKIATTAFVANAIVAAKRATPLSFCFPGKPGASAKLSTAMPWAATVAASLVGSVAYVGTIPAASAVFTVNKLLNGSGTITALGTVTFAASGSGFSFTLAGAGGSLATGDVLQIVAPATQDTTLADASITIYVVPS